jgi:hypothetical protein
MTESSYNRRQEGHAPTGQSVFVRAWLRGKQAEIDSLRHRECHGHHTNSVFY